MIMPRGLHLDANTISALRENLLTAKERDTAFEHLAVCGTCRDWLALNTEASATSVMRTVHAPPLPLWAKAAAAALCVIAGSLLLSRHAPAPPRAVNAVLLRVSPTNARAQSEAVGRPSGRFVASQSDEVALRSSPQLRRALFRPILFNTPSDFSSPQTPGPWGRAKLAKRVKFKDTFLVARTTSQDASESLPALNQISIRTNMGERWITLTAFEATAWQAFR